MIMTWSSLVMCAVAKPLKTVTRTVSGVAAAETWGSWWRPQVGDMETQQVWE